MKHLGQETRGLGLLLLAILCTILLAGLWPLNPFPRNDVSWLGSQNGLLFGPQGTILSSRNIEWPRHSATTPCSLEIWLVPDRNASSSDIINFYTSKPARQLRLFQWSGTTLLLYKDVGAQHHEIDVEDTLHTGVPVLVTIAGGPQGTSVYLNGELAQRSKYLQLSATDCSGQLVIGNSPVGDTPWKGEISRLAIYATELAAGEVREHFTEQAAAGERLGSDARTPAALYEFSERKGREIYDHTGTNPALLIPDHYEILHKPLLVAPWKDLRRSRNSLIDICLNVVGFIPLGVVLCAYVQLRSRRAPFYTLLLGSSLSLAIEIAQVYLPTRTSSLADVLTNTLGVAIGIFLLKFGGPLSTSFSRYR